MSYARLGRFLYTTTYVFLALPYLVFFGGWIRQPYAAILIGLLFLGTGLGIRSALRAVQDIPGERLTGGDLAWILIPPAFLVLFTGTGGWGWQDADWLGHNSRFVDLVQKPWPVVYDTETEPLLFVYYIAFYLPAALVGKVLGWQAANHALFVYCLTGVLLAALWVTKLTGVRRWWVVPLFLAFSGMDVVGMAFRTVYEVLTHSPHQPWQNLEWWAGYGVACYNSNLDLLVMTPNQALPAWLLTSLVLNDARENRLLGTGIFYLGISTLWGPYVSIGLLPFILVLTLPTLLPERRFRDLLTWPNAIGLGAGLVVSGYFACRFEPYMLPLDVSGLYQEHFTLTWFRRGNAFLVIYPVFVMLEFGLLQACIYGYTWLRPELLDRPMRTALYTSTAVLLLLPWINLSWNNDIVMRASIPSLFVTLLVSVRVLGDQVTLPGSRLREMKLGVLLVLLIGALNAIHIFGRQIEGVVAQHAMIVIPDDAKVLNPFELQIQRYNHIGFNQVGQYLGSMKAPFARYVLANAEPSVP